MLSFNSVSLSFSLFSAGPKTPPASRPTEEAADKTAARVAHWQERSEHHAGLPKKSPEKHPIWGGQYMQMTIVSLSTQLGYDAQATPPETADEPGPANMARMIGSFFMAMAQVFTAMFTAFFGGGSVTAEQPPAPVATPPADQPDDVVDAPVATEEVVAPVAQSNGDEVSSDPTTEYLLTLLVQERSVQVWA